MSKSSSTTSNAPGNIQGVYVWDMDFKKYRFTLPKLKFQWNHEINLPRGKSHVQTTTKTPSGFYLTGLQENFAHC